MSKTLELIKGVTKERQKLPKGKVSLATKLNMVAISDQGIAPGGNLNIMGAKSRNEETSIERPFKKHDKVKIHSPEDWDWHGREGHIVGIHDQGFHVKLHDTGHTLGVDKDQVKHLDEESHGLGKPNPWTAAKNHLQLNKLASEIIKRKEEKKQQQKSVKEDLGSNATASDYIDDFVHSKNEKFKGDSKAQRIRRALAAFYGSKK